MKVLEPLGGSALPAAGLLWPLHPSPVLPPRSPPALCCSVPEGRQGLGVPGGEWAWGGTRQGVLVQGALSAWPSAPRDPMTPGLPLSGKHPQAGTAPREEPRSPGDAPAGRLRPSEGDSRETSRRDPSAQLTGRPSPSHPYPED